MTTAIPDAVLTDNPLARAISDGMVTADDLAPFAVHLDALVASNAASTKLMAQRHHGTDLGEFHVLSHESEQEAHRLVQPFVTACLQHGPPQQPGDALALAYPAHIARVAVIGTPWDHPVSFLHLVRASTRSYRQLRQALQATDVFDEDQLAHFTYFGHVDDSEITATRSLVATAPADALAAALDMASQLAFLEELFWDRMVLLCTPKTTP
ncbi:hypothetical protein ACSOSW_11595 [Micrococcus luteus KDCGSN]|uniref:hypothetical protein n=1 Tax=Micrococcus luteus TaxID=1270 RepID=UPI0033C40EF7